MPCVGIGLAFPAKPVQIVHPLLLGIAENLVGRNNKAVSFEFRDVRNAVVGSLALAVWMVQLRKLKVTGFAIRSIPRVSKDLVRGRVGT
jgi:hypothetical protein